MDEFSVVDPNPHGFGSPGSGCIFKKCSGSRSMEIEQNLQIKLVSCLSKGFVPVYCSNGF
jgi:hypothetical protein